MKVTIIEGTPEEISGFADPFDKDKLVEIAANLLMMLPDDKRRSIISKYKKG